MLLNRAIRNGVFSVSAHIINLVLGLLFAGMTIKHLGNAQAGFMIMASFILGWTSLVGGGSFRSPAVQRISFLYSEYQDIKVKEVLKTLLTANIVVAIPFAFATLIAFPLLFSWSNLSTSLKNDAWIVILCGTIGFLLEQWSSGLRVVYAAKQRFDIGTISLLIFGLFGNLARLFVLIKYKNMPSLAVVNLIISFLWLVFDLKLVSKLIGYVIIPGWNWSEFKPLMSFGLWSWLGDVSNVLFFNLSNFIVSKYLGSSVLPYIAFPQRIITQVHLFFASGAYFLFPTLAGQGINAEHDIKRVEDRLRWFFSVSSIAIYIGLFLCGPWLFTFLVNKEFSEHAMTPYLLYCIWGITTTQMLVYLYSTMAVGKVKANTITDLTVSILTVVSTYLLVPVFGYLGICIAQLWKVPGVLWHTLWCRRLLNIKFSLWATFSPYVSTIISASFWIVIHMALISFFSIPHSLIPILAFVEFFIYTIFIWLLEIKLFSHHERLDTIHKVLSIIKERLQMILLRKVEAN